MFEHQGCPIFYFESFTKMFNSSSVLLCISSLIVGLTGGESHGFIIDDFSAGPQSLTAQLGAGTTSHLTTSLDPRHVAAASRYITFNVVDPFPTGDSGEVAVEVDTTGNGVLRYTPDSGLAAANFYILYGHTNVGLPSMSLDLLADGADRFLFDFEFAIPDSTNTFSSFFAMDIQVYSGNGSVFGDYIQIPSSSSPVSVEIPFAQIISERPTFDLADVTEIRFGTSNGTLGGALELNTFRTVPEPGALLWMMGLAGVQVLRRRSAK